VEIVFNAGETLSGEPLMNIVMNLVRHAGTEASSAFSLKEPSKLCGIFNILLFMSFAALDRASR
jgi:hypothetical protein